MNTKKIKLLLMGALLIFSLSACAMGVGAPVNGAIFTKAIGAYHATENTMGNKKGESTATSVLGLFAFGDASISTAAKNAGITKIATVDRQSTSILGLFATSTTIVTGE